MMMCNCRSYRAILVNAAGARNPCWLTAGLPRDLRWSCRVDRARELPTSQRSNTSPCCCAASTRWTQRHLTTETAIVCGVGQAVCIQQLPRNRINVVKPLVSSFCIFSHHTTRRHSSLQGWSTWKAPPISRRTPESGTAEHLSHLQTLSL